jgi:hypothetical protein
VPALAVKESLADLLRSHLAAGSPIDALFDQWRWLEVKIAHDPASFAQALDDAARLDASAAYAAIAPAGLVLDIRVHHGDARTTCCL